MLIPDDISDYNSPSLTPSRALTQATEPDAPCGEPTEEQVLEMGRSRAEYTAKFAELQASYTKDPETYAAARAEAEENRRLAEQLTSEIEQYKYEQRSEQFGVYQQKYYEARQTAKQKDQCDYTLVDKLAEDDAGHIREVSNRLVNLGTKLGASVIMSFCQLDESSLLTFSEASTLEERQFIDTYKELVSITMAHYLQPRVQFAVEAAEGLYRDIPENNSDAANPEDLVNPAASETFETIDSCTPIGKANDRGLTQSSHSLCIPSWDSNSGNKTEQGLWNTLRNIFSTHGLEIEFHFSPCTSLIPPLLAPLPLGNPEVAMQVSLIFAQLFALCWIRGFHIELYCLPSNPTCNPPIPSAPAQPFVLKSIPIQRGWWTDQVEIQKEAGALVDPIKFAHAISAGKRRWSPYPVKKGYSLFKTILVR